MADSIPSGIDPGGSHPPLSETELDELADFLESDAVPDTGLSLEQADGFLCALAVGPLPTSPSQWLPIVWGSDDGPEFESAEQARHIMALLMRHWNWVANSVRIAPQDGGEFFLPLVYYPDEETPDEAMDTDLGREWAEGFAIGINMDGDLWDACIADEDIFPCFAPIILLELGHNPDQPELVIDYAKRKELVMLLPMVANEFYGYWRAHPPEPVSSPAVFEAPYRAEFKPGRNDPCPCGSGKKFKKCCGRPEPLH
jgi:uncharacterized protein